MNPAEPGPTSNLALIETGNWAQTPCSHAHPAPSLPLQTHRQTDALPAPPWDHSQRLHSLLPVTHCRPVHQLRACHSGQTQRFLSRVAAHTAGKIRPHLIRERAHPVGLLLVWGSSGSPGLQSPLSSTGPAHRATGKTPCDEVMLAATCPGLKHTHISRWRLGGSRRHRVPHPGSHPWVVMPHGESWSWALGRLYPDYWIHICQ